MLNHDLSYYITLIPALLIAFAFHEWAHAAMADYMGDPTPRSQGRLSLNPFVHLDLFGTLVLIVSGFGWAKPVQTNPTYYRGDKRKADLLVSLAGVVMNFIIAFVVLLLYRLIEQFVVGSESIELLLQVLGMIVLINVAIGVFNLLPIPPLDGFHALMDILPEEIAANLYRIEQYGMFILMFVFITGLGGKILLPARNFILEKFDTIATFLVDILA